MTGTASESQLVGMEGLKTVLIRNSTLSSSQTGKTASDPVADGVIIYQSTSGDAESTTGEAATFQAVDSKLSSAIQSGSMFYLTNTSADVVLKNTELDFASSAARLLYAAGNDANNWGQAGSNGATVKFTGIGQQLAGDVVANTISSVDLHLAEGTTWAGAASIEQNAAGSTSDAPMTVNIDGSSQWTVTADSTVSPLNVAEGAKVVDADGKTVTIVAGGQTVVQGDSGLTVTVTGPYSTDYDASEAGSLTSEALTARPTTTPSERMWTTPRATRRTLPAKPRRHPTQTPAPPLTPRRASLPKSWTGSSRSSGCRRAQRARRGARRPYSNRAGDGIHPPSPALLRGAHRPHVLRRRAPASFPTAAAGPRARGARSRRRASRPRRRRSGDRRRGRPPRWRRA